MILIALLQAFVILVLPVLGIALITLSIRGGRRLTRATCARCRAELSFQAVTGNAPCTGCGAAVSEAGDPLPCKARFLWKRCLLGALVLGCAAGLVSVVNFIALRLMQGPPATSQSPAQLVGNAVSPSGQYNGALGEIGARFDRGELAAKDVAALLATHLAGTPNVPSQSMLGPSGSLHLATLVHEHGGADGALFQQVLGACYPPAALNRSALTAGVPVLLPASPGHSLNGPVLIRRLLVRSLEVDGARARLLRMGYKTPLDVALLDWGSEPPSTDAIPRGTHHVKVTFEALLNSDFDSQRMLDSTYRLLPRADWPAPLASAVTTEEFDVDDDAVPVAPPTTNTP